MSARLVFLGSLADLAGREESVVNFSSPLDWPDVMGWLSDLCSDEFADRLRSERVKVAINGVLLADKEALEVCNGDEVAFLPPVSGG